MSDNPTSPQYTPGWYPDTTNPGTVRYHDGTQWTEHTQPEAGYVGTGTPGTAGTAVITEAPAEDKPKKKLKWWQWGLIGFGALIVLIIIIGSINGKDDDPTPAADDRDTSVVEEEPAVEVTVPDTTGLTAKEAEALLDNEGLVTEFSAEEGVVLDRDNWTVLSTTPAAGETANEGDTVVVNVEKILTPEEKAAAEAEAALAAMTMAQRNAVSEAQNYVDLMGFSRADLLEQLTSEYGAGYEPADAEFAVAYLEKAKLVDWNAEAVESAQSYLDTMSFSRDSLYEQLTSSYGAGFTPEQANYALSQVGY